MAKRPIVQTPYIMKSALTDSWYIVTKYVEKRGMCAIGPDAGKTFDYLIAKEKFDCTERMHAILKAELARTSLPSRGGSNRRSAPRKVRRA